jgi:hypothetical protein
MGKKKSRTSQTSKGERNNVSKKVVNSMRRDYLANGIARINNQIKAMKKGKRVMVTIENPNKNETNKRFIRVPGNEVWKFGSYSMKPGGPS